MEVQYGVSHDPLYVGLRLPTGDDILPLPIVFEPTPLSIALAPDGFWPRGARCASPGSGDLQAVCQGVASTTAPAGGLVDTTCSLERPRRVSRASPRPAPNREMAAITQEARS